MFIIRLQDNKCLNQKDNIEDVLAQLNRDRYPLSVLKNRPLPDGVNPLTLEMYLNDEEFEVKIREENFFIYIFKTIIKLNFKGSAAYNQRKLFQFAIVEAD
jgi:hypothetical protein